jgi:hypothetical protein
MAAERVRIALSCSYLDWDSIYFVRPFLASFSIAVSQTFAAVLGHKRDCCLAVSKGGYLRMSADGSISLIAASFRNVLSFSTGSFRLLDLIWETAARMSGASGAQLKEAFLASAFG